MKRLKKMMALVIAAVMVLAMSATALAGTITVTNVKKGETYKAYKILEYSSNEAKTAYSYYLETSNEKTTVLKTLLETAGFEFTTSADGTRYVLKETSMTAEQIVSKLKEAGLTSSNVLAYAEKTAAADGEAVFSDLATGYWFVTTTTGSLCSLTTYDDEAMVVEKNTVPTVDKTQSKTEGSYADTKLDLNVGDTVYYQLEVTDGTGTNTAITLTDTMTEGLTYNTSTIKINGSAVADDADNDNWSVTVSGQTITIVFKASYVDSVASGDKIVVTFNAKINEKAVVDSEDDNNNEVILRYSNQSSSDKVYVETYDASLKKTDGSSNPLSGAKFNLFTTQTDGEALKFKKDDTGYYLSNASDASAEIDAGNGHGVNIRGLEPGTYWFEETVAPDGYNKLNERVSVTVASGQTAAAEITVVNNAGSILPSTGGVGTTMFYIIGAILVIGAGVVLVARRRMNAE